MSGYKQTVLNDDAITFITFDSDYIDSINGTLNVSPLQVLDEVGNQNPALLHIEHDYPPYGYRMGTPSLVKLEQTLQNSICFSYINNNRIKAFLEVPNSSTYLFPNYGSFTIEFLMKKQNELPFIQWKTLSYYTFERPIISKGDMLDITAIVSNNSISNGFRFTFPSGNVFLAQEGLVLDKTVYVCVVWDVQKIDNTHYRATERLMFDGKVYYENEIIYSSTFPSTQNIDSWLIGGNLNPVDDLFQDRNTSPLYIDQFAIYDYGLTINQVATHYKKLMSYDDMILNDYVTDYYPLNDTDNPNDYSIRNANSSRNTPYNNTNGVYYGTALNLFRDADADGLSLESGTKATKYLIGALGYFTNSQFDMKTTDYSIGFWFRTTSTTTGTLFAYNNNTPPFEGIEITINERLSVYHNGGIQVSEGNHISNSLTHNIVTNQPYSFNDGKWHYLVYQRTNTTLELYIDSTLHSTLTNCSRVDVTTTARNNIFIMSNRFRKSWVVGQMCKLERYTFALQPQQIQSRYSYSKIYRIKGIVTLQGIPTRATIRILNNFTGQLIGEIETNHLDGSYIFDLPNNDPIDIMVFDRLNANVRYRAYGSIIPTGENDFPITI